MVVLDKDTRLKFPHVLVIDASAGSGKTETLAQRFVQFILSSKIPHNDITNILAITFTNNAAREMKQRILKWLKKLAFGKDCREKKQTLALVSIKPEEIGRRAQEAIEMVIDRYSDFHIQTIDSFMNKILNSSAVELGIPMENEITDSYTNLIELSLSLVLASVGETIARKDVDDFLELLMHEVGDVFPWNPLYNIKAQFENFLGEEGKVLEEIAFDDQWSAIKEQFRQVCDAYEHFLTLGLVEKSPRGCKAVKCIKDSNIKEFINSYSPGNIPFKTDKKRQNIYDQAKQTWNALAPQVEEMVKLHAASHYCHYGALYRKFKKYLDVVKRKLETIHYDDINKKLSQYVEKGNVLEIYYRLGDVLYHFLLDEFQDTDKVQWENMQSLFEEAYSKGGSLFAVGDTKQAIYMFRKADYKIMRDMVNAIKSKIPYGNYLPQSVIHNATVKHLTKNFRSGSIILEYVDSIFKDKLKDSKLLEQDFTGLTTYIQEPADRGDYEQEGQHDDGYVKAIVVDKADDNSEKEVLLKILDHVLKRYQERDVAILTRTNGSVEEVVEWLIEKDIQVASFSSLDIRKRKIIMEIVSLLRWLDSPVDSLSFADFILGNIFLKALETMVKDIDRDVLFDDLTHRTLANSKNPVALYIWLRDYSRFKDIWPLFFKKIFENAGFYPLYDLVSQIYRTFNVFENFPEETGFLVRFLEAICAVESKGMNNLKDFMKMVSDDTEKSGFDIILPDYIDAVKVMTFHKAKGLGFPIVINLIYESGPKYENMLFKKEGNQLMIYHVKSDSAKRSTELKLLYEGKKKDNNRQDLNLLYVANTRAKNELYNIVVKKNNSNVTKETSQNPSSRKLKNVALFDDYEKGEKKKRKKEISEHYSTKVLLPRKEMKILLAEEDKHWHIGRLLETKKGEFYHKILSKITFVSDDIVDVLDKLIQETFKKVKESYNAEEIKKVIMAFLGFPEVKPWFEKIPDRQVQQEVEYIDEEGSLHRFDRVLFDKGAITVIDFKTGEKLPFYRKQIKNYMDLLQKIHTQRVVKGYLAYIDTQKVEEVK